METLNFTVDAALIQELGERLIGKPQIALSELIKNSYDADASTCQILFDVDSIQIVDDGHGMAIDEFQDYWMRIGTTHKLKKRLSRIHGRSLTGSKGIGRLAVQFLAGEMILETASCDNPDQTLYAIVDWGKIERGQDLASVEVLWEHRPFEGIYPFGSATGTRITLNRLKDQWGEDQLQALGQNLWTIRSPFRRRVTRPVSKGPEDFDIEVVAPNIESAQEALDMPLNILFDNWKARISGSLERGRKAPHAVVNVEFKAGYPDGLKAERFQERVPFPLPRKNSPEDLTPCIGEASFEILVFKFEGRQPGGLRVGELRHYLDDFGNVSIYDSGFRLPYYGAEHDWLDIAADQARRLSVSELLPSSLNIDERYMLDLPEPRRLFGAVEIRTAHERSLAEASGRPPSGYLQLQPGRDRLHENMAFEQLRNLVRFSVDYYANRYRVREARRVEEKLHREPASSKRKRAIRVLDANKPEIPASVFREVRREVKEALEASQIEEQALDERAALLAPLASAGMAALALNHELAREERFFSKAVRELRKIAKREKLPELLGLAEEFESAAGRVASLQAMFTPLLSDTDKKASDRLKVKPVVEQAVRASKSIMPRVEFELEAIPPDLRFPIGSMAEWNALLQNVLANAWNAMLSSPKPKIHFEGGRIGQRTEWLRISDTGVGLTVPLDEAPQLFEPFERRLKLDPDVSSLAIGGQGLGLSIVRMIARRRNADVSFVEPSAGFAASFQLSWKG